LISWGYLRVRPQFSTNPNFPPTLRLWDGSEISSGRRRRLLRVWTHHAFLRAQIAALAVERRTMRHSSEDASLETGRPWMQRRGIGVNGAWGLVRDFFAWRACNNRRQGGLSGLNAAAVSQRREDAGTRHHQVGQSSRALDAFGVGLELGTLPA
jgi:hypothetical protein